MLNTHRSGAKALHGQQIIYPSVSSPASASSSSSISIQQQNLQQLETVEKNNLSRNVQILSKSSYAGSNNNPTTSQTIRIGQPQMTQNYEFNTKQTGDNVVNSLKTIYMNNNNNGNLNLNRAIRNTSTTVPVDYSERQQKHNNKAVPSPISVEDGVKYSFNFQQTPVGQVSQNLQHSGSNTNKTTKIYADNHNVKNITCNTSFYYHQQQRQQQQPQQQPQQHMYSETGSFRVKSVKNQPQVQVSQQRSTISSLPQQTIIQGKHFQIRDNVNTSNNKYAIQRSMSPGPGHHVQQIRYTCGPPKVNETQILYNEVVNINNSQTNVIQPLKSRTLVHHIDTSSGHDESASYAAPHIYRVIETKSNSNNLDASNHSSTNTNMNENYMIVNGTKITEEMSARILHDLSRNSKFCNTGIKSKVISFQHSSSTSSHPSNLNPQTQLNSQPQPESTWTNQVSDTTSTSNDSGAVNNKYTNAYCTNAYQPSQITMYPSYRNVDSTHTYYQNQSTDG